MIKYIGKRILFSLVSLLALITVTFFLTRMMPGNPFQLENINPSVQEQILKQYGLDRPVGEQFLLYLKNLSHGDLGMSYKKTGISVNSLIAADAPYTILLGVLIGIWMAVTKKESIRGGLMFLTICGISIPNYVLALLLVLIFGVTLQWFPVVGLSTWKHYVLPVITLSVYPIAQISKLVKSSYTEAKNQDYTIMARAKGISRARISMVHIMKNAMVPVITISGPMIAFLLTGSFVAENIFTIPGIGREFVNAVGSRDYTVIMGLTIFLGMLLIVCNLVADILCTLVDPRIKLEK